MTTRNNIQSGFSLVETLVALSILLIAVVAPISLIGDSLHKIYYAKDQMIAINLAQEGIEIMRSARDTNKLRNTVSPPVGWDNLITPGTYIVDVGNIASNLISGYIQLCASCDTGLPVYFDVSRGQYRQSVVAGTITTLTTVPNYTTQFSRVIKIEEVSAGKENKITSTVTWKTGGQTGNITVLENIFNWQP